MHDLFLGITYENTDLRLNINESSRCMVLIERHLNATDRNGYEQFHSESSAEEMYTYEELLPGIPKCGIGFITMETEEKVCFVLFYFCFCFFLNLDFKSFIFRIRKIFFYV